jgi:hypothetical protein
MLDERVLESKRWLYFKLYDKPTTEYEAIDRLKWYNKLLSEVIKPWEELNKPQALFVSCYGIAKYGPDSGREDPETLTKKLDAIPEGGISFVRLRAYFQSGESMRYGEASLKDMIKKGPVWDFEQYGGYDVLADLGNRYARVGPENSIDKKTTISFIEYWASACKYILNIVDTKTIWNKNVDVWGIPHLVNNAVGGFLRVNNAPCSKCETNEYLSTGAVIADFFCPKCERYETYKMNM